MVLLFFGQFDALLVDYLHPRKFSTLGPFLTWALRATTLGVVAGMYQFNTNDIGPSPVPHFFLLVLTLFVIGLTELIAKVWTA